MYLLFYQGEMAKSKNLKNIREFLSERGFTLDKDLSTDQSDVWVEKVKKKDIEDEGNILDVLELPQFVL